MWNFIIFGTCILFGQHIIAGSINIVSPTMKTGQSLLNGWNINKSSSNQVKVIYKADGGRTFENLSRAIAVSGTKYWISARRRFREPLVIPKNKPVYLLLRLYASGSAGLYGVNLKNDQERFQIKLPCHPGRWQTCIIRINDMMRSLGKKTTIYSPEGQSFKILDISQRCVMGDETAGKSGETLSPEHSFIIGEVKLFKTAEDVRQVEALVKKMLPDPFYHGKLVTTIKTDGNIKVWSAPSVIRVFKDNPLPTATADSVFVSAPKNGWESCQLVVNSVNGGETASLAVSDLKCPGQATVIPSASIDIYPVGYVHLTVGPDCLPVKRWYPDPLSRNKDVKLESGKNQPFWISCYIPPNVPAGVYQGMLTLSIGDVRHQVPFKVKVWDFSLPLSPHFRSNMQLWGRSLSKEYWQMQQMLARYKLYDANRWFNIPIEHRKIMAKKYGQNTVKMLGPFGHGRRTPLKFQKAEFGTDEYEKKLINDIKRLTGKLAFLPSKDAYVYIWDEPMGEFSVCENMVKICNIVKNADPDIKTLAASAPFKSLIGHVDYFLVDYSLSQLAKAAGAEKLPYSFWRGNYPPRITETPLGVRLYGFENWKFDFSGYFAWGISVWKYPLLPKWYDPWLHVGRGFRMGILNGEGLLIYPGNVPQSQPDIPCYSIRLEMLRDMVTDYECLYLLNDIAKATSDPIVEKQIMGVINECMSMVKGYHEYENNPEKYYRLREKIAESIVKFSKK